MKKLLKRIAVGGMIATMVVTPTAMVLTGCGGGSNNNNGGQYQTIDNPTVALPTTKNATYGQTLANFPLQTPWTWQQAVTTSVGAVGTRNFNAVYTRTGYANLVMPVAFTVAPATSTGVPSVPTGLTADEGDLLSTVALTDGWAWVDGSVTLTTTGNHQIRWRQSANHTWVYETVSVTVTPAGQTPTFTLSTNTVTINDDNLQEIITFSGTAQSSIIIDQGTLPFAAGNGVVAGINAQGIIIGGQRPTGQGEYFNGTFTASVTRQGITQTITVHVNLTST